MTRESAQLFALALLTMPWSVNNYVMTKGDGRNIAVTMLADAAASSVRLLSRMKKNVSSLHLQLPHSTRFLAACDGILRSLETANLCELDDTLAALQHSTVEISLMVGVMVLTSHEYRELIYQSVRHVTSTSTSRDAETEFNLDSGTIVVPGAFGVKHVFYVDLDSLLQHMPSHTKSTTRVFRVNHTTILLAALKAYNRSLMFSRCIDGSHIKRVMSFEGDFFDMY